MGGGQWPAVVGILSRDGRSERDSNPGRRLADEFSRGLDATFGRARENAAAEGYFRDLWMAGFRGHPIDGRIGVRIGLDEALEQNLIEAWAPMLFLMPSHFEARAVSIRVQFL